MPLLTLGQPVVYIIRTSRATRRSDASFFCPNTAAVVREIHRCPAWWLSGTSAESRIVIHARGPTFPRFNMGKQKLDALILPR